MTPSLRIAITAAALSASGFVLAQAPTPGVDLGAVPLKRANAPTTTPTKVLAPTTALPAVQKGTILPGGAATPAPAPAASNNNQASNNQAGNNNQATNQTGIGNVVQTPLKNRASDILTQSSNNPSNNQPPQNSNDVQVKMPSLFRRP